VPRFDNTIIRRIKQYPKETDMKIATKADDEWKFASLKVHNSKTFFFRVRGKLP
jgi:hypothetical protein